MKRQAIDLKFNGRRVRLAARLRFTGDWAVEVGGHTIKSLVMDELARQFSNQNPYFAEMIGNAFDFPEQMGQQIKVSSTWVETDTPPYVRFHVIDALGICAAPMFPVWRRTGNKYILLFTGDIRLAKRKEFRQYLFSSGTQMPERGIYRPEVVAKIGCHEFGHALGLGDLYGGWAPYGLCYRHAAAITPEMPRHDIMRTHFCDEDFFTPNDLEMALLAQQQNAPQTHFVTGPWFKGLGRISAAVRLQNIAPDARRPRRKRR